MKYKRLRVPFSIDDSIVQCCSTQPTPTVMTVFENAVSTFRALEATVLDDMNFQSVEEFRKVNEAIKNFVIISEFKSDLRSYLAS